MAVTTITPPGGSLTLTGSAPGLITGDVLTPVNLTVIAIGETAGVSFTETTIVQPGQAALTTTPEGAAVLAGAEGTFFPVTAFTALTPDTPTLTGATNVIDSADTTFVITSGQPLIAVGPPPTTVAVWNATRTHKRAEEVTRRERPLIRIWDAEWHLQHVIDGGYRGQFSFISNDTGPGQLEIPFDSPAAKWIHDHQGRIQRGEKRNVFITIDHCGARWSGIMDKYSIEQRDDGDVVLVIDWMHDYEFLKFYTVWSNPFLPAFFQFPRAWILAGPVSWVIRTTLFAQIFREHNPLITWPDDPMNLASWFTSLDQSNWHVVVKPQSFFDAMKSGVVWGILISRWANFHDAVHSMLEDAELSIRCDRYLVGDPLPWPGANLRNGALVIDVVDKSGIYVGTSAGGTIFDGLVRTAVEFADDFLDSTATVIEDADTPRDYFLPDSKYTSPVKPYVVFQEGENSPIQTSAWINSPAKAVQIAVGGHSAPGVNEAISACLAPNTLIDGPNGKERIDVLAARGEPFEVWSITPEGKRTAATASIAFRKGYTELFTYTLTNGSSITVTKDHRFLTPSGFTRAAVIKPGDQICVVDWKQDPVSAELCNVADADYVFNDVPVETVTSVQSAGWDYFYDMTVPGWENYAAHGIWNHNTIQAVGDILGNLLLIGSLGGSIDTLLKPLYEDVLLAWISWKSSQRAQNSGWARLFEYFQTGSDRGYTLASLMVLRAGLWATKTQISWKVSVADGRPFLIGDRGVGHFFLDDRVGLRLAGDDTINMDRCRKIDLAWDPENPPEWQITIGDNRIFEDPSARAWGKIERLVAGLRDLGVYAAVGIGISAATLLASSLAEQPTTSTHMAAISQSAMSHPLPRTQESAASVTSMTHLVSRKF